MPAPAPLEGPPPLDLGIELPKVEQALAAVPAGIVVRITKDAIEVDGEAGDLRDTLTAKLGDAAAPATTVVIFAAAQTPNRRLVEVLTVTHGLGFVDHAWVARSGEQIGAVVGGVVDANTELAGTDPPLWIYVTPTEVKIAGTSIGEPPTRIAAPEIGTGRLAAREQTDLVASAKHHRASFPGSDQAIVGGAADVSYGVLLQVLATLGGARAPEHERLFGQLWFDSEVSDPLR